MLARLGLTVTLLLAGGASASAQQAGLFGRPIENWTFTYTYETPRLVNCRAIRKAGGREDIAAMRTDGHAYLSVRAEGRRGKYKDTIIDSAGISWTVYAEADAQRLWFTGLNKNAIEMIMAKGRYDAYLGGTEDNDKVNLGRSAAAAWARVKACVVAYGG